MTEAKQLGAPYELVKTVAENGRLPVPNFAAGGIATPADAALCMALGGRISFRGLWHLCECRPREACAAIVDAATHWESPEKLVEVSKGLGEAMPGLEIHRLAEHERLSDRGW